MPFRLDWTSKLFQTTSQLKPRCEEGPSGAKNYNANFTPTEEQEDE